MSVWRKLNEDGTVVDSDTPQEYQQIAIESVKGVTISTVFLGVMGANGYFETMCFGHGFKGGVQQCSGTKADALAMHAKIKAGIEDGTLPSDSEVL